METMPLMLMHYTEAIERDLAPGIQTRDHNGDDIEA